MDAQTILTVLLGAGGTGALTALFAGMRALQRGVSGKTREGIADLARWRDEANEARERAERARDAWRAYAGTLEYQLLSTGGKLPDNAVRPSE